jgi:hypothetical protein
MGKRRDTGGRSIKSARLLEAWGVERKLDDGAPCAPVGPVYLLDDGRSARLAFYRDDERRLCVGYAVETEGRWQVEEGEPFSARGLGYYQRRLKRIGRRSAPVSG